MNVKIKKLSECASMPEYATDGSAGADIRASETVTIAPGETRLVPTGLSMEIPVGYVGLLFPRSGLSIRRPLRQPNSVGVIDSDYRGEVRGIFTNVGDSPEVIEAGTRMAQMVIVPCEKVEWTDGVLSDTERGSGGFGHTGIK